MIDSDEADILVYERGLQNAQKLTASINKSITSIQKSTYTCQKLFEPILSTNQRLATLSKNIEEAADSIASIKDVATDASKHDMVLSQPIEKIGLQKYFKSIYKIEDVLENLAESANRSNYLPRERIMSNPNEFQGMSTNLQTSVMNAEKKLQQYFLRTLNTLEPFDPQISMNKRSAFPYFEDADLEKLNEILKFFHGQNKYLELVEMLIQQRGEYIMKCMAFCEQFTKSLTHSEQSPYEKGQSGVISYCEALTGFISNEQNLLEDLNLQTYDADSLSNVRTILIKILSPVITSFTKVVHHNMSLVKKKPVLLGNFTFELNGCITKVIKSLNRISFLQQELEPLLKESEEFSMEILTSFITYIAQQSSGLNSLPSDFRITGISVDVMSKLRKLSDYSKEISELFKKLNPPLQSWLGKPEPTWHKYFTSLIKKELTNPQNPDVLLGCYYGDCLDALCISLDLRATAILSSSNHKAHSYFQSYQPEHNLLKDSSGSSNASSSAVGSGSNHGVSKSEVESLVGFFVFSNISLIEEIVSRSSDLTDLLNSVKQRTPRLERLKKKYLQQFLNKWGKCVQIIIPLNTNNPNAQYSKKEKEDAKEKLRNFNTVLEILCSNFKNLKINDPAVKKELVHEITHYISPPYRVVWNKYQGTFKNREKYLKYTPDQMDTMLNALSK
ncbi:hypothetical protein ACO0QE_004133 [Hanseniaspora vineae]